ncbi:MAG: hypothetical protein EA385_11115 [Salinarimonadaceae bacterium]|nr:MAG: hypothetical protein EA385_11115 [Salinarimonadaceae bacterium]
MAALTNDRNTRRRAGDLYSDPVAAATIIYAGALVCLNAAGNAVPGATATGLKARGVATARVDNSDGSAGDAVVESEAGVFRFANSTAGDAIARADIGADAWIVDDQTVAKTGAPVESVATRSIAGKIMDVDNVGVWVRIG